MTASFSWTLQERMHAAGIHQISELRRELNARGIDMSSSQMHRLVTQTPERLNLTVLATLCEVLQCSPADLISVHFTHRSRKAAGDDNVIDLAKQARPRRAQVQRDEPQ